MKCKANFEYFEGRCIPKGCDHANVVTQDDTGTMVTSCTKCRENYELTELNKFSYCRPITVVHPLDVIKNEFADNCAKHDLVNGEEICVECELNRNNTLDNVDLKSFYFMTLEKDLDSSNKKFKFRTKCH